MIARDIWRVVLQFFSIDELMRLRRISLLLRDWVVDEFRRRGRTIEEHLMFMKFLHNVAPDITVDASGIGACVVVHGYICAGIRCSPWHILYNFDGVKTAITATAVRRSIDHTSLLSLRPDGHHVIYRGKLIKDSAKIEIDGVVFTANTMFLPTTTTSVKIHSTQYEADNGVLRRGESTIWRIIPEYNDKTHIIEMCAGTQYKEDGSLLPSMRGNAVGMYDDIIVFGTGSYMRYGLFYDVPSSASADFMKGICVRLVGEQLHIWKART